MAGLNSKLDDIIHNYLPSWWYAMSPGTVYNTYPIAKSSATYKRLHDMVQGDFNKNTKDIFQVQNPIVYEQFQLKVVESSLYGSVTVKELMHCTSKTNALSIMENNFDWRVCGRVKYGRGVSFTGNACYAHLQSSLYNGEHRAMIIADVIVGDTQIGGRTTVIPDEPYDTTISKDGTVYVKYYDNEFYPKYVVYYDGCAVGSDNGRRYLIR